MSLYEIIQNIIRLSPIILLLPAFMFFLRFKWYQRLGFMFVLGWLVIAGSTLLFWGFSISYAPSQEIAIELALRDGAPRLFGTLFGWAFGLAILFIFEVTRLSYIGLSFLCR
jgi:hypothetical protein